MRKTTNGFTIIELIVVITIIGILATIGIVSFASIQSNANDTQKSSKLSILSSALEKYYSQNGEYPSCAALTASPSTVATNTLKGIDPNVIASPTDPNTTNISCTAPTSSNFAYIGGGGQYTLEYKGSTSGNITSVPSQRTVVSTDWIPGIAGTVLQNKYVYHVSSPATVGSDSYFKWDSAVSACASIGGRLPTITELQAIADGYTSYGNNFFNSSNTTVTYWSGTEVDSNTAWRLIFWFDNTNHYTTTSTDTIGKAFNLDATRCVKG